MLWQLTVESALASDSYRKLEMEVGGIAPEDHTIVLLTARTSNTTLPLTVRYCQPSGQSLSVRIPFVRRSEAIVGPGLSMSSSNQGIGDIQLSHEQPLRFPRSASVSGSLQCAVQLPTGASRYESQGKLPLGSGHYEISATAGAQRIADPILLTASLGLNYSAPRRVDGIRIAPGIGHLVETGISVAVSDRLILSEQLTYVRNSDVLILGAEASTTKIDQAYLTHSLLYHHGDREGAYRLSLSLGLNDASTDAVISCSRQRSF
jgi:hypothetical protein